LSTARRFSGIPSAPTRDSRLVEPPKSDIDAMLKTLKEKEKFIPYFVV
jgi:hypothetical protein